MNSQFFIKQAADLIDRIEGGIKANLSPDEMVELGDELQKETNQMFAGLQNPTLPSAYRLRDAALAAGLYVKPDVMQRLAQFEYLV